MTPRCTLAFCFAVIAVIASADTLSSGSIAQRIEADRKDDASAAIVSNPSLHRTDEGQQDIDRWKRLLDEEDGGSGGGGGGDGSEPAGDGSEGGGAGNGGDGAEEDEGTNKGNDGGKESNVTDGSGKEDSSSGGEGGGKDKPATPPPPPGSHESLQFPDEEESHVGAIFGLLFLLGCGGAAWKYKDKIMEKINVPAGMVGSPTGKAKYHEVYVISFFAENAGSFGCLFLWCLTFLCYRAVEEKVDEEWGWGDDEDDGGDVELSISSKDDNSVHKRRTSSNESLTKQPSQASSKTSSMSSYRKTSPRITSQVKSHTLSEQQHIPKLPNKAPPAGPGMSLSKPSVPTGGVVRSSSASKPKAGMAPSAQGAAPVAPSPATAPVTTDYNNMQGLKISSLGPKISKPATPAKPPAPAPSPEDDIFASMGLSAKPTFSHAPAPPPKPMATTSSRWGATTVAPAAAASTFLSTTGASFGTGDGDGDDDNWDDDGDLDDLLDD